jgi:tetratricopeptide (TPR) repeat protein
VLLLSPEVRAALDAQSRRDPSTAIACEAAAALHLGRAPTLPLSIGARAGGTSRAPSLLALAPLDAKAAVVVEAGVRITSLERTIVDLLARPSRRGGVWLASELLRSESALERRAADPASLAKLAAGHPKRALRRRVAWLCARAGHEALARRLLDGARGGPIALDALGARDGASVPGYRLRLNTADGFDDPGGSIAAPLGEAARARFGGLAVDLALLLLAAAPVDLARLATPALTPLRRALERCAEDGLLDREGALVTPRRPFDRACAAVLATTASPRRNKRAARLAEALADGGALAGRVDAALVLAAAGDPSAARRTLRGLADEVAGLDAVRATRVLALLAAPEMTSAGPADARSVLRRKLAERLGRWNEVAHEARARLATLATRATRSPHATAISTSSTRAPDGERATLQLALARACWRLGRHEECRAQLRALQASLTRSRAQRDVGRASRAARAARATRAEGTEPSDRTSDRLAIEVGLLRATVAMERGEHARAFRLLREVLLLAERASDDLDRARALHRLGTLDARRGRFVDASASYRAALEVLPEGTGASTALRGVLHSNLAATTMWLGRWDEAQRLAGLALHEKQSAGTVAEVVVTRVLLARIARARGAPVPAAGRMSAIVEAADRTGDARLRVEAWLDLAEELARAGDLGSAEEANERARTALALLAGAEPVLEAMTAHVGGLLGELGGDVAFGVEEMDRAATALDALDGTFWAARARRDAASACERAGLRTEALVRFEAVARACARARFQLGEEATHAPLYALAALEAGGAARGQAERVLAALGPSAVRTRLVAAGRRALADALRARRVEAPSPEAVAIVRGADGARFVDAPERARLLRGVAAVLLLDESGPALVRPDGVRIALGRRRVVAPLLRALAARGGEPLGVAELAREVWERRDGASTRAAIKMSISRLRSLLGPSRTAIAVARAASGLAYAWTDALELRVLTPVAR